MFVVGRQKQVLRQINFDAVSFTNSEGGQHIQVAVENTQRRLGKTGGHALFISIQARAVRSGPAVAFAQARDGADGERYAEDLQVVMIHLITQAGFPDLIQALELIKIDGITVRHDEAVEENREAFLPKTFDLANFSERSTPLRNQKVLTVTGIKVGGDHAVDGAGKTAVQPVGQNGFQHRTLEYPIGSVWIIRSALPRRVHRGVLVVRSS